MKKLKKITVSDIRKLSLCYLCYDPAKYMPENWSGTALDVLTAENIPAGDRLWVACRTGIIDNKTLLLFDRRCLRETPLSDGRKVWDLLTNECSRTAVEVAEKFTTGEATKGELEMAKDAARDTAGAAWHVAWEMVRAVVAGVVWYAAAGAVWYTAVRAAAGNAAVRAAAGNVARDEAYHAQIKILIALIRDNTV